MQFAEPEIFVRGSPGPTVKVQLILQRRSKCFLRLSHTHEFSRSGGGLFINLFYSGGPIVRIAGLIFILYVWVSINHFRKSCRIFYIHKSIFLISINRFLYT